MQTKFLFTYIHLMNTTILFLTHIILISFVSLNNNEFSEISGYNEYLIKKFSNATDEDTSTLDSLLSKKRKYCLYLYEQ